MWTLLQFLSQISLIYTGSSFPVSSFLRSLTLPENNSIVSNAVATVNRCVIFIWWDISHIRHGRVSAKHKGKFSLWRTNSCHRVWYGPSQSPSTSVYFHIILIFLSKWSELLSCINKGLIFSLWDVWHIRHGRQGSKTQKKHRRYKRKIKKQQFPVSLYPMMLMTLLLLL